MNSCILSSIVLLNAVISTVTISTKLVAISNSEYALQLYEQVRSGDEPSESDPACLSVSFRRRICDNITNSGYFSRENMEIVHTNEVLQKLRETNSDILSRIYSPPGNLFLRYLYAYEYVNPYVKQIFRVTNNNNEVLQYEEHVFVCLLKNWISNEIVPYYVSKKYNVLGVPYKNGRFVFGDREDDLSNIYLAEEPASAFEWLSTPSNVEMEYLERRKHRRPEIREKLDPVCKLVHGGSLNNQHIRLCAMVLKSSYFQKKNFDYPDEWSPRGCDFQRISFKTTDGVASTKRKSYYERMVCCHSRIGLEHVFVYISRAYKCNEVFVYFQDDFDNGLIHLEKLMNNVPIVREPPSFDDVED